MTGKYATSRYGTYKVFHQLVKHGFQSKVIKNSTVFVHCVWSHDSEFCLMDPSFKIFYLSNQNLIRKHKNYIKELKILDVRWNKKDWWYLRQQQLTKMWLKHFKCINSWRGFGHYASKTLLCIFIDCFEKWRDKEFCSMHSIKFIVSRLQKETPKG